MGQLDVVNSLASVVTILTPVGIAAAFMRRRAKKWFESIEARFDTQAEETEKVREEAASTRTEVGVAQAAVASRLDAIETQLKPNGGSTHHDLMAAAAAAAVRTAVKEMADDERGRDHRRRRWPDW